MEHNKSEGIYRFTKIVRVSFKGNHNLKYTSKVPTSVRIPSFSFVWKKKVKREELMVSKTGLGVKNTELLWVPGKYNLATLVGNILAGNCCL